ncbi:MAG: DegT/DnrJ/EryC1/StrS family aminotransferase, partial [Candidatus Woesearchaeota archaeon]|nr:DegT/DnrJ/EryC1/StrS family aminotransferase [Candidatus Woesearchaeota archaeon]
VVKEGAKHVFHQYTIKVKDNKRDQLMEHLKTNNVGSNIYYPKPLHLFLKNLGYKEGDFPVTEALSKEVLSLPVHPSLTEDDINKIITSIQSFQ